MRLQEEPAQLELLTWEEIWTDEPHLAASRGTELTTLSHLAPSGTWWGLAGMRSSQELDRTPDIDRCFWMY